MTEPLLLNECTEDVEEVVVAWLTPLRRCAAVRRAGDELPFTLVHHIDGTEKPQEYTADELVSVHTLCDRALGEMAAKDEAKLTHRRMLLLAKTLPVIDLSDGRQASVDFVQIAETPRWEFYSNEILRKVARYAIGLSYIDQPDEPGS